MFTCFSVRNRCSKTISVINKKRVKVQFTNIVLANSKIILILFRYNNYLCSDLTSITALMRVIPEQMQK